MFGTVPIFVFFISEIEVVVAADVFQQVGAVGDGVVNVVFLNGLTG